MSCIMIGSPLIIIVSETFYKHSSLLYLTRPTVIFAAYWLIFNSFVKLCYIFYFITAKTYKNTILLIVIYLFFFLLGIILITEAYILGWLKIREWFLAGTIRICKSHLLAKNSWKGILITRGASWFWTRYR